MQDRQANHNNNKQPYIYTALQMSGVKSAATRRRGEVIHYKFHCGRRSEDSLNSCLNLI